MLKKLLSFSLVAVMLSTVALAAPGVSERIITPTYAAEPEVKTETFYGHASNGTTPAAANKMEWIYATDGETQTFAYNKLGGASVSVGTSNWVMLKINVGPGWNFSADNNSTLKYMFYRMYKGMNYLYAFPSSKVDWEKAYNARTSGLTGDDKFAVPTLTGNEPSGSTNCNPSGDYQSNKSISISLSAEELNACYDEAEGYLYMTLVARTADGVSAPRLQSAAGFAQKEPQTTNYHCLTLNGTKTTPVVDDFSDAEVIYDNTTGVYTIATTTTTAEAYLIIASFTGTTMSDVELVTVNAATASRNDDGAISGTINTLDEGTIKIFLLDKATLAPATPVQ